MEKPITLIIEELKTNIASTINNSNLPIFVIDNIFKDFYSEIHSMYLQQLESDKKQYELSIKDEEVEAKKED